MRKGDARLDEREPAALGAATTASTSPGTCSGASPARPRRTTASRPTLMRAPRPPPTPRRGPAASGWSGSARSSPTGRVPAPATEPERATGTSTRAAWTSTRSPTSSTTSSRTRCPDDGVRRDGKAVAAWQCRRIVGAVVPDAHAAAIAEASSRSTTPGTPSSSEPTRSRGPLAELYLAAIEKPLGREARSPSRRRPRSRRGGRGRARRVRRQEPDDA